MDFYALDELNALANSALAQDELSSEIRDHLHDTQNSRAKTAPATLAPTMRAKSSPSKHGKRRYLLKFQPDAPLVTASDVQFFANLDQLPEVKVDENDESDNSDDDDAYAKRKATFVELTSATLSLLATALPSMQLTCYPIRGSAAKKLDSNSIAPFLGRDSTLPQFRLQDDLAEVKPRQKEFPVCYFFYDTLCERAVLSRHTRRDEEDIVLVRAKVRGGRLETWGRYRGLVDGTDGDVVQGMAFWVERKEEEEGLRAYETERYDVVRCEIEVETGSCKSEGFRGLTFRLVKEDVD